MFETVTSLGNKQTINVLIIVLIKKKKQPKKPLQCFTKMRGGFSGYHPHMVETLCLFFLSMLKLIVEVNCSHTCDFIASLPWTRRTKGWGEGVCSLIFLSFIIFKYARIFIGTVRNRRQLSLILEHALNNINV